MIMPFTSGLFRWVSQISASFFQSGNDMSSEAFMNGISIIGLQIFFISGAMFRISSLSVEITPPDFGSSREEIVPPVIKIATVGNFGRLPSAAGPLRCWTASLLDCFVGRMILAFRISFSLIPMLYPDFSFSRIISGSWDCRAWPSHVFVFVLSLTLSPGLKVFVFIVVGSWEDIKRFGGFGCLWWKRRFR